MEVMEYPKELIMIRNAKDLTEFLGGSIFNRVDYLFKLMGITMPFQTDKTLCDKLSTYICVNSSMLKRYTHDPTDKSLYTIVKDNKIPYLGTNEYEYTKEEIILLNKRIKEIPKTVDYLTENELQQINKTK